MKIIISSVCILVSLLLLPKKEQKNEIIGTWKMDLYLINLDTVYYEKSEKYTINYFETILLKKTDNSEEKKLKIQNESKKIIEIFKTVKLHINKNSIKSYEFDGGKSEINLKYKIVDGKIIIDEKTNQKYEYTIEYNKEIDVLTIKQGNSKMSAVNRYSRIKN